MGVSDLLVDHTIEAKWKRDRRPGQTVWLAAVRNDRRLSTPGGWNRKRLCGNETAISRANLVMLKPAAGGADNFGF